VNLRQRTERFVATEGPTAPWLTLTARNRSTDAMRARKSLADEIDTACDRADPEEQTAIKGIGRRIDSCMEELEADGARAVRSAHVEGLSDQELAERHAVPLIPCVPGCAEA
jgi:RNA polymerase sigma-70 factor (ECF subfamily)